MLSCNSYFDLRSAHRNVPTVMVVMMAVPTRVIDLRATRVNLVATMMAVMASVVAVLVNAVDTPTIVSG